MITVLKYSLDLLILLVFHHWKIVIDWQPKNVSLFRVALVICLEFTGE